MKRVFYKENAIGDKFKTDESYEIEVPTFEKHDDGKFSVTGSKKIS